MDLHRHGVLERFGCEMIGAKPDVIDKAEKPPPLCRSNEEDRPQRVPRPHRAQPGRSAHPATRARPSCIVRPSFTMGGSGSSIAYNRDEFESLVSHGLELSPIHEVLIEESIIGWKEYEMEVMRDVDDNVVIICAIENFDPMGIHTGDSITVAPAQTLSDKEYQRDARRFTPRDPRDRRRNRRIEHPIRDRPALRPDDRRGNESARQPLERASVKGHWLSDCQDRRQARRGLPPARTAQRHHARDDGLLRADESTMS